MRLVLAQELVLPDLLDGHQGVVGGLVVEAAHDSVEVGHQGLVVEAAPVASLGEAEVTHRSEVLLRRVRGVVLMAVHLGQPVQLAVAQKGIAS